MSKHKHKKCECKKICKRKKKCCKKNPSPIPCYRAQQERRFYYPPCQNYQPRFDHYNMMKPITDLKMLYY